MTDTKTVTLMNFGDNARVIHNHLNLPTEIRIGQSATMELHSATMAVLGGPDDALVIIPHGAEIPPDVTELMALVADARGMEYDELLSRTNALIGGHPDWLRPTRQDIQIKLFGIAKAFAQSKFGKAPTKIPLKDLPPAVPTKDAPDLGNVLGFETLTAQELQDKQPALVGDKKTAKKPAKKPVKARVKKAS